MKNKNLRNRTSIVAIAASLLLAPLTMSAGYAKNTDRDATQNDADQRMVEISGSKLKVDEVSGANVVNRDVQNLGEIEDVVYSEIDGTITHVIISTDEWFDGRTAVIPVGSLEQADAELRDNFFAKLRGGIFVLNMEEDQFDQIATFKRGTDLEEYLEQQASELASVLELDEADVFDKNLSYHSVITNRSADEHTDGQLANTDDAPQESSGVRQYRYNEDSDDLENQTVEIDGQELPGTELKGVEVVNHLDDRLGKVVDIIVDSKGSKADYLVVRTDNWFDGDHAVIPVKSIKYHADTDSPHPDDGANWWMGDHVVLSMTEDKFEDLADYRREEDPNVYINRNRERMSDSYSIAEASMPVTGTYYGFAYTVPYTRVPTVHESQQAVPSGYGRSDKPSQDRIISLGDSRVRISELKDKSVKDKNGKKVATVSDAIADTSSGKVEFLVLENARNGGNTIVPVSSIESSTQETEHDHKGDACAIWSNEGLTLSSKASEFKGWATFEAPSEFNSFLDDNASSLSDAFGIDESDFKDSDKEYVFIFESGAYQTASR
ncbi:PRC-barrel domain-containing protein [Pelagicoccus sp. SDUM812002]|uniref:PRC-barrel domain-containing protein n=1 Tax=Pelagicoccus sp. SDUM812002 TaxID=3041266 RepID=UPI00280CED15|nr:PRC-barrel domain-containing protein [Pelagicoccus sp. SDUM812002]MDQ8187607.1 PRC-barrel domain-containing protein [Pelagicoccus sp. SDUM812002]